MTNNQAVVKGVYEFTDMPSIVNNGLTSKKFAPLGKVPGQLVLDKATGNLEIKVWNSSESQASFKMNESKTMQDSYDRGYKLGYEQGHSVFNIEDAGVSLLVGLVIGVIGSKIYSKIKK